MAALKIATVCMLLLLVGSDLARPAAVCVASSPDDDVQDAALLRELLERELTQKLSLLLAEQHGAGAGAGAVICTPACQTCLIICGITCVPNANPATCFANCTVTNGCFSKTLPVVA